jgi:hypothetical protein
MDEKIYCFEVLVKMKQGKTKTVEKQRFILILCLSRKVENFNSIIFSSLI